MSIDLFNSGSNFVFKINYSDVMSMNTPLPWSFLFFFFIKKIFKNRKYIVGMRLYSPGLRPLSLHTSVRFRHESPSPYLRK